MKKDAGIKTRLCAAILLMFFTMGCGANSVHIVTEQDAVMPDIELVETQSIGESTQNTERVEEIGEVRYFGYEEAYPFHEGTACVRADGKFGYIDMNGETVLPFVYDRAAPFSEGLAYFAVGDTYGFMDESGEPVFYLDCESVSSFSEGRAYIYKDGKYGYIDRMGKIVIEPVYDDATYFKNGAAIVRKGGFYGVIGLDGEELLPTVYEESQIIVEKKDVSLKASEEILANEITPDSVFYKCANTDIVFAEGFDGNVSQVDLQSIDAHKTSRRLYGQVSSGTLLYLSIESYDWLLTTDYYAILGEDAAKEETILVYENYDGGGYQSGFWYDEQEQKLVQGRAWHYGGSGNVYGREFFEEQDGSLVVSNSWGYFYDRFEGTESYTVNDKEAVQEEYEAMGARYRWIEILQ